MNPGTDPKDEPFSFEDEPGSFPSTGAERQSAWRRADPDRHKAADHRYMHNNSKWQTDASYLRRHFVAWDGEGISDPDGSHRYVMLAVKSPDFSDYLGNVKGLGTAATFEFILDAAAELPPDAIHVIFGGGYDFNMWMRDLSRESLEHVYKRKYAKWGGYRIGWRPGKSFYICRTDPFGVKIGRGVTIYDVVSFFQCPFVKACDDYLGERFYNRERIVENKALRSSFTEADIPEVRRYNEDELENLLRLMVELRARLNKGGLRPRRWDGPGAIAAALLQRENVKAGKGELPPEAAKAARHAYAGGRFEVIRFGNYHGKVWEYDVNSAYPAAMRNLPDLSNGTWRLVQGDLGKSEFALYHVRYAGTNPAIPGAFFRRDANGTISYPMAVTGWYWAPEVEVGRDYCARGHGTMEILETWTYEPAKDSRSPFHFITPMYAKRRELKKNGDGAHVGYKLALNSLYGKTAQQIGAEMREDGTWRTPPFHQLEWAGYTTSWCRATVLRACLDNLSDVVAFETDAVFTTAELPVTIGAELGDFEAIKFDNLTYVQSGMYFAQGVTDAKGYRPDETVTKTRGVDRGSLTREMVLEKLAEPLAIDRHVTARLTRFIGAGVALSQSWDRWRTWEIMPKQMVLEPTGKRAHMNCECMHGDYGPGLADGMLHRTACPLLSDAHSAQFPIMWINPDPNMTELAEFREQAFDYDD